MRAADTEVRAEKSLEQQNIKIFVSLIERWDIYSCGTTAVELSNL